MPDSKLIVNNELVLYGPVGKMWYDDSGFDGADVLSALAEMKGDLSVRLNSGGGIAFEGIAIYNALRAYDGKVTVKVDGVAASAASVIAMAGDDIVMGKGAMMMIHDPSGITIGPAEDHRKTAETLDAIAVSSGKIYASRTKLSLSKIQSMMDAETWMDGDDAVKKGFATSASGDCDCEDDENCDCVDESMKATMAFDYSLYRNTPDRIKRAGHRPLPAATQERNRPMTTRQAATPAVQQTATMVADPAVVQAAVQQPVVQQQQPAVQQPVVQQQAAPVDCSYALLRAGLRANLSMADADAIAQAHKTDEKAGMAAIVDKVAGKAPDATQQAAPGTGTNIQMGQDAIDKFMLGAEKSLLHKASMKDGERNEFSGMTLSEMARFSLEIRGRKPNRMDRMIMIGQAFTMEGGMASTSDFANILANVAHKAMMRGWEEAGETFQLWTNRGTLTDFKPMSRVDLNLFPALAKVLEGAEYTWATLTDRGTTIQLATYGKLFSVTRQTIINDDLNALTKVPNRMGRAAARTVGSLAYAQLTSNPTLGDGVALFHSTHKNLAASGGPPTMTSLNTARSAMALQADPDSLAAGGLNIRPAYMLVPVGLEGSARQLIAAQYDPAGTAGTLPPNIVKDMAQVIADARLDAASATAWYLAADKAAYDTIEVAYLNGVDTPVLEQRNGWSVDGVEMKVRIDAGVAPLDFRTLYKNAGA